MARNAISLALILFSRVPESQQTFGFFSSALSGSPSSDSTPYSGGGGPSKVRTILASLPGSGLDSEKSGNKEANQANTSLAQPGANCPCTENATPSEPIGGSVEKGDAPPVSSGGSVPTPAVSSGEIPPAVSSGAPPPPVSSGGDLGEKPKPEDLTSKSTPPVSSGGAPPPPVSSGDGSSEEKPKPKETTPKHLENKPLPSPVLPPKPKDTPPKKPDEKTPTVSSGALPPVSSGDTPKPKDVPSKTTDKYLPPPVSSGGNTTSVEAPAPPSNSTAEPTKTSSAVFITAMRGQNYIALGLIAFGTSLIL
ncbi:hypothetical protein PCASD_16201 [Puccinia coronata f. sp. avenae]|uniref:Uncharacterized protein n=1 Tax=Puccinia coronata f. sp. avenae TaxID=200324 RepID=A0A2N5SHE7_9BASI|nr:hypothetical protein PCASD_16201 [Puccinia coronata f. sp. avenae]